jgi:hypothetical protein
MEEPMTIGPGCHSGSHSPVALAQASKQVGDLRRKNITARLVFSIAVLLLSTIVFAQTQGTPKITKVDPSTGKVGDSVAISGMDLAKDAVAGVFLSDDKSDYKAAIVSQAADKIVMKVPQVKPGGYNVSIQVATGILIEPVRFTVE